MSIKPITLTYVYNDEEEPLTETLPAYLIGEDRAMFVSDRLLWALEVRQSDTDPDTYVGGDADASLIIAEDVEGSAADVILPLIERWSGMTALDFILRDLIDAPLLELGLQI
ncbi:hypothetical protein [Paenibacillus sabinae]|uniref:Uncharacterized protein n=1 Tax=Paenibacillus sabinae T27 TaxID=1268072 RepID=X4ZP96_9BACL|nr:hypothetical protein [Paenibacillus sabinae]AHV99007.1 hypothetical protein PSAB_20580 [Paenibacillus sabinae T27]